MVTHGYAVNFYIISCFALVTHMVTHWLRTLKYWASTTQQHVSLVNQYQRI